MMRLNIKLGDKFFNVDTLGEYKVVEETNTTFYLAYFNGSTSDILYVDKQMSGEEFDKQYRLSYKSAVFHHIAEKQRVVDSLRSYYNTIQD